jgi:hypothetical protein
MADLPPSDGDGGEARRIALPNNIAQTLKYLNDLDLEALRVSVENELQRRRADRGVEAKASAETGTSSENAPAKGGGFKTGKKQGAPSLPVGKASLIRASFESGMKPAAIARTLRISVAQVNEVLANEVKRKR